MIGFEFLNNEIRFFNQVDRKIDVNIVPKLRTTLTPVANYFLSFKEKNHWFIPKIDYNGCGVISVYEKDKEIQRIIIPKQFNQKIKKQNLICLGLNKTGTTSFKHNMELLGYNTMDENIGHQYLLPDVYHGDLNSTKSLLDNERFNLYEDIPFSLPKIYEKIYDYRPNDIYVLTIRNSDDEFVDSFLRYYEEKIHTKELINSDHNNVFKHNYFNFKDIWLNNLFYTYFTYYELENNKNIKKTIKEVYNKHNEDIINFFSKKIGSNFMVINVSKNGELKRLTNWLGIKNNEENFVWINKTKK